MSCIQKLNVHVGVAGMLILLLGNGFLKASDGEKALVEIEWCEDLSAGEEELFKAAQNWEYFCKLTLPSSFCLFRDKKSGVYLEHVAARYGQLNLLHFMEDLNSASDFSKILQRRDFKGWTALHHACNGDQLKTVIYLLQHGVCFDVRANGVVTPAMVAKGESKKYIEKIAALFEAARLNKEPDLECLKLIPDVVLLSEDDDSLVQTAVTHGSLAFLKKVATLPAMKGYLLSLDKQGQSSLWWALNLGYEQIAILLAQCLGEISAKEFLCAFNKGRIAFMDKVINKSSFVQQIYDEKLLHEAVKLKDTNLLAWLLSIPGLDPSGGPQNAFSPGDLADSGKKKLQFRLDQRQAFWQQMGKEVEGKPSWQKDIKIYSDMQGMLLVKGEKYKKEQDLLNRRLKGRLELCERQKKETTFFG